MADEHLKASENKDPRSTTAREFMTICFRHRSLMINTFLAILGSALLVAFLIPRKYVAQMKILVRHEREQEIVSPQREAPMRLQTDVSEEELQSEAELIKSRDLLAKVVVACNLAKLGNSGNDEGGEKLARAVLKLESDLTVEPIKLTNLISVSYKSPDPQLAAKVLNSLASLYLEKHLAMHRASGEFEFFQQQADGYRKALGSAEEKLTNFSAEQGVVNPTLEEEISVRKLAELEADAKAARATMAETKQRIQTLGAQLTMLPNRETTAVRKSDNPELMQNLKSKLLELELKRTDLLSKFEPTYRPVQEVEQEIAQARSAIEAAENAPLRDETTDRDPTYEALRGDLAKAKTDLAAMEARSIATSALIKTYQTQTEQLNRKELLHQDMQRTAKADEENYLLYLKKEEEARISDALDRQRFSNVVVAEPAAVPFKPQGRWAVVMVAGAFFAALASVMLAFVTDRWDPSFRTPEEVETVLGIPVLAAFPKSGD